MPSAPTTYDIVKQAHDIYHRVGALREMDREEAIRILASHGVWSLAHIGAITGAKMHEVRRTVSKSDHTGGRFDPNTLGLILEEYELAAVDETNDALIAAIVDRGTGPLMLARLLGVSISRVRVRLARHRRRLEAA